MDAALQARAYARALAEITRALPDAYATAAGPIPRTRTRQIVGRELRDAHPEVWEAVLATEQERVDWEECVAWIAAGWDPCCPVHADLTRVEAVVLLMEEGVRPLRR